MLGISLTIYCSKMRRDFTMLIAALYVSKNYFRQGIFKTKYVRIFLHTGPMIAGFTGDIAVGMKKACYGDSPGCL
jgi:hypothetical protein